MLQVGAAAPPQLAGSQGGVGLHGLLPPLAQALRALRPFVRSIEWSTTKLGRILSHLCST